MGRGEALSVSMDTSRGHCQQESGSALKRLTCSKIHASSLLSGLRYDFECQDNKMPHQCVLQSGHLRKKHQLELERSQTESVIRPGINNS